ncbi:MAG TPA: flagellar filament capping protein FliD [Terriglobales bacterium]|jgi:flagellar hook-associated protein 2|nr:flagellar filament capping protein FliD [Terriglobales bacterium]
MGISLNPATLLSGQGIDISSVVQQILSQKSGQLQGWQQQQTDLSTQAGLLQGINNNLINLTTAVNSLVDPRGALSALSATSSSPAIAATVQTSATAGVHQISVTNLATQSLTYSDPVANGTLSAGSFSIQVGSGTAVSVPVTANETLDQLASYINGANLGVTANVINDANGARLSLLSNTAGQAGTISITANTVSGLNFNTTAGNNAALTVDGVPVSSASNTVSGVIPGVTLTLAAPTSGTPAQLTIGTDPTQITDAINNFVSAYNSVVQAINTQFTVDPTTNAQGPLGSDGSLRTLQTSLLNDVTYSITGNGGFVNLASLGIDLNNDGTLTVNTTATADQPSLSNILATNPAAVQTFFQNVSATGFANHFGADLNNLIDPTEGVLTSDIAQNGAQQRALTTSIQNFQDQLATEQASLTTVYAQVNATLQAYPLLLQQVTETLGSLPTLGTTASGTSGVSQPTLTSGL